MMFLRRCAGAAAEISFFFFYERERERERERELMQSFEPGEDWVYCFADEVTLEVPGAADSPSHP